MVEISSNELILIRHGATDRPKHLCGRTDAGLAIVPAMPEGSVFAGLDTLWVSPARRARQTAEGLWPGRALREDARLWEQDFGTWDGKPYADVPDMGPLDREELAGLAAPDGESFAEMVGRVVPALREMASTGGPVAVVAHAGGVRAALAMASDDVPGALAFEVDHLSVTRLRCLDDGGFSVISVNGALA